MSNPGMTVTPGAALRTVREAVGVSRRRLADAWGWGRMRYVRELEEGRRSTRCTPERVTEYLIVLTRFVTDVTDVTDVEGAGAESTSVTDSSSGVTDVTDVTHRRRREANARVRGL